MRVSVPDKHPVKVIDFPRLDGGLNLWELDYRLDANQSPNMKNLWWQDGILQCRDGQEYLTDDETLGTGYACYESTFWDHGFFHIGDALYHRDMTKDSADTLHLLIEGVPENRGTFFRYFDWLFYKNRGGFFRIEYADGGFAAVDVRDLAYTPIILLNTDPETGAGDTYQPENRLSPRKEVWYNAKQDVRTYRLPLGQLDSVVEVKVNEVVLESGYTVDTEAGTVTFDTAPPVTTPPTNNTVVITYEKANDGAMSSIMDCKYAAVYGGDAAICIVLGGCPAQPNAMFWNANDDLSMNAAYWPIINYNLAGDTEEAITGFGKQYGSLIVLKERSVGRCSYSIVTVDERSSISLTYVNINSKIGCDLPWTVQLVNNNIVFCNRANGVHMIRDSSAAYENNIVGLSRNVNGTKQRPGLLEDLKVADRDTVCGFDDDNRYWVCANGHAYVWDYLLSEWSDPSWFYFTNINGVAFTRTIDTSFHINHIGKLTQFIRNFADYDDAIEKIYQFPPQFFDNYDRLKDVLHVIFTVRSDTDSEVKILYQTDYGDRYDLTPIRSFSWKMAPRNLAYRYLNVQRYAHVAKRKPGTRHVRHFAMQLQNNEAHHDLAIVSAQIYYKFLGRDR